MALSEHNSKYTVQMPAARRVASASADSLRKRERQIMAAAYDLANKSGAFSISFVAKRTSVNGQGADLLQRTKRCGRTFGGRGARG